MNRLVRCLCIASLSLAGYFPVPAAAIDRAGSLSSLNEQTLAPAGAAARYQIPFQPELTAGIIQEQDGVKHVFYLNRWTQSHSIEPPVIDSPEDRAIKAKLLHLMRRNILYKHFLRNGFHDTLKSFRAKARRIRDIDLSAKPTSQELWLNLFAFFAEIFGVRHLDVLHDTYQFADSQGHSRMARFLNIPRQAYALKGIFIHPDATYRDIALAFIDYLRFGYDAGEPFSLLYYSLQEGRLDALTGIRVSIRPIQTDPGFNSYIAHPRLDEPKVVHIGFPESMGRPEVIPVIDVIEALDRFTDEFTPRRSFVKQAV